MIRKAHEIDLCKRRVVAGQVQSAGRFVLLLVVLIEVQPRHGCPARIGERIGGPAPPRTEGVAGWIGNQLPLHERPRQVVSRRIGPDAEPVQHRKGRAIDAQVAGGFVFNPHCPFGKAGPVFEADRVGQGDPTLKDIAKGDAPGVVFFRGFDRREEVGRASQSDQVARLFTDEFRQRHGESGKLFLLVVLEMKRAVGRVGVNGEGWNRLLFPIGDTIDRRRMDAVRFGRLVVDLQHAALFIEADSEIGILKEVSHRVVFGCRKYKCKNGNWRQHLSYRHGMSSYRPFPVILSRHDHISMQIRLLIPD